MQKVLTLKLAAIVAALALAFAGAPAVAAPSLKPTIISVDNRKPAVAGGTQITVTGTNFDTVTSVTVDNNYATVASKTAKTLVFIAPQHALGVATVLITNPAGTASFAITYSPQRRPVVPSPILPDSIRLNATYKVVAQDPAWKVTITSESSKICTAKANTFKGIKRGTCVLNIEINPDPANGSNPNWRGKVIIDSVVIR